jgi:predicted nuclease of predicted toxin-antitoxin system
VRFLIDECLSPRLVAAANRAGFEAYHVAHIGRATWQDWNIAAFALTNDLIFVTNNATDFRALYTRQELHSGLIIILPSVDRETGTRLFNAALGKLREISDFTNKVLEVDIGSGGTRLEMYNLPPTPE